MKARPVCEQAADVDVEHLAPLVRVGLLERRAEHHAGVGDDEVDRAERVVDAVGEAVGSRDVGGDRDGALAQLGGERLEAILAAADERDGRRRPRGGRLAVAVPMPAVAPVTTAVRLLKSMPRQLATASAPRYQTLP